jgi:hypothetical protein
MRHKINQENAMPYLDRDGAKLFFEDNGQPGDTRTVILWTHEFSAGTGM